MRRLLVTIALAAALLPDLAPAQERVDVELVLLADASRSIDDGELMLQRSGYAAAITHPLILSAIMGGAHQRIALTYVEWADENAQDVVVPWTTIDGPDSATDFAARLMAAPRRSYGPNAIGSAIAAAQALIETNDIAGERLVIDFSGDSANSFRGLPLPLARQRALDAGIIINGLAVLCRTCSGRPVGYDLERAFAELITGGPGSFVITAETDESFATAVRNKLLLEIAGLAPR